MIDPVSFLILILVSVSLAHLTPRNKWTRLVWLTAPGVILIFIVHPLALLFSFSCFAFSMAIFVIGRITNNSRRRATLPYLILALLFAPKLLFESSPILWIGSAFFIVRQMITVSNSIKKNADYSDFISALTLATYNYTSVPSGPIFDGLNIWDQLKKNSVPNYSEGIFRTFEGFVYLFAISGFVSIALSNAKYAYEMSFSSSWFNIFLNQGITSLIAFMLLFCSFYGYSRIAEGSAMLFGFEVPENFNKPHMARDIGDFWKRWHRSMADFVMQYLYLPLLVYTSKPKLALVLAFIFMGAWHKLSFGFLFWGLFHGLALAFFLPWALRKKVWPSIVRILSLAYVVALSSVAHGVF